MTERFFIRFMPANLSMHDRITKYFKSVFFVPCRREDEDWQEEEYSEEVITPNTNFDNRSNTGQGPMAGIKGSMPPGDANQGRGQFNQGPIRQRDGMGNSAPPGNINIPPKSMGPNFRNDNMNSGGMMPGNMGPGGRNAPPGNFGNMNSGNFGGMNNMPFPGPDQRNMGPPGPMNNPPRFQGNQGTDIVKSISKYVDFLMCDNMKNVPVLENCYEDLYVCDDFCRIRKKSG